MNQGKMAVETHYLQLQNSFVWRDLLEKLEAIIQKEKDLHFNPQYSEKPENHRLRAMYFEEFLKKMKSIVNEMARLAKKPK